jgi:hypothetical protein
LFVGVFDMCHVHIGQNSSQSNVEITFQHPKSWTQQARYNALQKA